MQQGDAQWLSILIPVYNVAEWIGECVRSIVAQQLDGVEVILLDDASTDGSRGICEQLSATHDGRLRLLVHEQNRGLSAARNTMLAAAKGQYLWFIDGDDRMLPGALAGLRELVLAHQPDVVMCDFLKLGRRYASFVGPVCIACNDREALLRGLFRSRRMHVWTKITRRALWDGGPRFPEGRCFEDMATMPWLFLRARSFFYIRQAWIEYRVREGSIMHAAARTRGHFDAGKNDDLAGALAGFAAGASAELPDMSVDTLDAIGQFCAKEFTKIGWRLLRQRFLRDEWRVITSRTARYRRLLESASPLSFDEVATNQVRQGKFIEWLRLQAFRYIGRRETPAS